MIRRGLARVLLATAALCGAACGGADWVVPSPELSESITAQRDMQKLREVWENGSRLERGDLERALAAHSRKFPADASSRRSNAMLAVLLVEKDELERAKSLSDPLVSGADGATRDAALVVAGAILRRRGDPAAALDRLAPLFNKIVDAPTRDLLNRELLLAAVAAKRFDHAASYLEAFVAQADPLERAARRDEAHTLVQTFPKEPLVDLWQREEASASPDRFLLGIVVDRLAALTIESGDVPLARSLLATAGALLGDRADAVARVAARGATVRLERNTVGLVVPLGSPELRRRGLDVASGLTLALGLPGGKTRLVTRDDAGDRASADDALSLLNSDGAAVIITGFDRDSADAAVGFSGRTGLPVVLLRPPERTIPTTARVFILGVDPVAPRRALVESLVGAKKGPIAMLVADRDADIPTDGGRDGVVAVQPCGAPIDFVHAAGARALVIDGGRDCVRDALDARPASVAFAFGLDAGGAHEAGLFATAGIFPIVSGRSTDPMLETFRENGRGEPSFWVALGHDAGVLVQIAVAALPAEDTGDAVTAAKRKDVVASAIERAEGTLWTTDARGFGGGRVLPRKLGVVSRAASR